MATARHRWRAPTPGVGTVIFRRLITAVAVEMLHQAAKAIVHAKHLQNQVDELQTSASAAIERARLSEARAVKAEAERDELAGHVPMMCEEDRGCFPIQPGVQGHRMHLAGFSTPDMWWMRNSWNRSICDYPNAAELDAVQRRDTEPAPPMAEERAESPEDDEGGVL